MVWWWNEKVQEAIKRKKECIYRDVQDLMRKEKNNYKRERNRTRKIVNRAMRKETEQEINDLCDKPKQCV